MNKILVTGAAGFIGSHLCRALLKNGNQVIGLDNFDPFYSREVKENNIKDLLQNPSFTFYELDICNFFALLNELKHEKPNIVVHLAAKAGVLKSISDTESYLTNNISGTHNLLEWMRLNEINKFIFASSSSVYGNSNQVPFKETDNTDRPLTPYATTKKACELLNYNYHYIHKMDVINLRFFTVYGPSQRPDLAIHKFIKLIYAGEPVKIYGAGDSARDYTYIDDTVKGIIQSIHYIQNNTGVYDTFNLGNNHPVPLLELVKSMYSVCKKTENYVHVEEQLGDMKVTCADISRAKSVLGYSPSTPIQEGLKLFANWFEQQQSPTL
jgi:nucleoside-diphosphate-sugar epimerase